MAVGPEGGLVLRSFLLATVLVATASAQDILTLEQATARTGHDFTILHEGRAVTVRGQVASVPVWALGSYYVSLRDADDHALLLSGSREKFADLRPGESVEAQGTIQSRAGLPLLTPSALRKLSDDAAPAPKELTIAEINTLRFVGLLARTRATVTGIGENLGGKVIQVNDRGRNLPAFLPRTSNQTGRELARLHVGDRVRLTGLVTQYAPEPPYDAGFQILLNSPEDIEVLEGGTALRSWPLWAGLIAAAFLLVMWRIRDRRTGLQRQSLRAFHTLCEEIISAESPTAIAEKLVRVLPAVTRATSVRLYLFNRRSKSLECVETSVEPDPMAVSVESPPEGLASGAAACFRNRTILNVPDVRRSPFVKVETRTNLPRSAMYVPLFAHNDVLGVLEVANARRLGYFTPEEQAAVQHLANQIAASLKLQEQQTMREQLFHSEKLAATGQLISGVASELRAPLEHISQLATSLAAYRGRPAPERDLRTLASESLRASEIVSRLVSFARPEDSAARHVDVNAVMAGLIQFRDPEWKTLGLRVQNRLTPSPALVLGAQGQIEQVFLNLLVHAEQCASAASGKSITIASSVIGGKVMVEINYSAAPIQPGDELTRDPFDERPAGEGGVLGLGVCRGIIQGHGGEIRFRTRSGTARFEVELPLAYKTEEALPAVETRKPACPLTVMLVDTDPGGQRQLLALLGARGHRAVPVASVEAVELAQRLRFDAVLWGIRPGGARWSEFQEKLRPLVPAFVLMSDGYDAELAHSLEENGGFLLFRPIKESELDDVLRKIEARVGSTMPARPGR